MIKNALKTGSSKIIQEFGGMDKPLPKEKKVKKSTTTTKKKEKLPMLEENEEMKGSEQTEEDFQVSGDLETTDSGNKKAGGKKPKKAKKGKKKKETLDGITRFFNDYGESPHLQAIEMSYLKYLEA